MKSCFQDTISELYVEHMISNDLYERVQQTLTFA